MLDPVEAEAPGRARSIRAPRPRHTFGPVSVSLLVGLQLAALVAVLVRMVSTPIHWVLLATVATVAAALVVPTRGGSVGTGVLRRLSFLTRDRVIGPASSRSAGAALYPGLVVRSVRDHRGRNLGVAEWEQAATAVVEVSAPPGRPVRREVRHRVPLRAIHERLAAGDIPVEAVTMHVLIPAAGSSGGPVGPWWRGRRDVFASVRIRPLEAREAITRRGGGRTGLDACLAAVTAAVVAEVRAAGLAAEALDLEAMAGVIDLVAAPGSVGMGSAGTGSAGAGSAGTGSAGMGAAGVGVSGPEVTPWTEGRHEVTGPGGTHRSLVATRWRPGGSDDQADLFLGLAGEPEADVTVAVEVRGPRRALGPGPVARVRVAARTSGPGAQTAAQAAQRIARSGTAMGLEVAPPVGDQLAALRASAILGAGEPSWADDAAALHPVVRSRIPVPLDSLDALAPMIGGGVPFGHGPDGTAYVIDLVHSRPQRIVTVGEGWVPAMLAGRAARCGIAVVVATDRPAPWQALMRQLGVEGMVALVPPDARTIPGDGDLGSRLLVVASPSGVPGIRRPWQSVIHVLASAEGAGSVFAGADAVIVSSGAGSDELARLAGVTSGDAAALSALGDFDVAAIAGGHIDIVRVDPNS